MVQSINPSADLFLSNLQLVESRITRDQSEISSGLRVRKASDAPDQIASILGLRAQISSIQQTQQNFSTVSPQVESGENAIQQAIQVMDTVTTLAAQAASSTTDANQQLDLVPQVQSALEQLVGLSQTSANGRYIFSGNQDQSASYALDPASGNGVKQLIQPGAPGQIEDANGVPFSVALTAAQIFDTRNADGTYATNNVFAAVNGLLTAMQADNLSGPNGVQQAIVNIKEAASHLNDESSFYGGVQNRITASANSASQMQVTLQQQLSNAQDADVPQVAEDLSFAMTAQQATMAAQAMNKPQSLFNYLG